MAVAVQAEDMSTIIRRVGETERGRDRERGRETERWSIFTEKSGHYNL